MKPQRIRLGDLSVGFVYSLESALRERNIDPQPLLHAYGLDSARLADPHARLSIPRYMRLGHAAIQLTGEPALGLDMGRLRKAGHLGLVGIAATQAPTVREAARTLIRFERLYASNYRGTSEFLEDAEGAWLRFYSISPYNQYNRFVVDTVLASWITQLCAVAAQPLQASSVMIEFDRPDYAARHDAFFGMQVAFGCEHNQLRLDKASLALRNPEHCPGAWQQLLELSETALEQLTRTTSLSERVAQMLAQMLKGQEPDLQQIAQRLQLPAWTLRRRLTEEGSSYRTILNDTRRDLAMSYIRDTELAFGEIAWLLGFSSAEAFQRAFKRWSGQAPGEFRRRQRRADT
ncbi:AraC family transcriptional regulator [Pseudomonas saudiphocaensis]|uniref:AraC family transcriptional regulator n=1 Tax=Pseudomonas saudiphocaensis TaxID=1499686 RepID=UPI00187D4A4E|nr:AraC family transcriptional regulator [Pseudomonas saudiphocaensis]MBE7926706.1 AraC family transcriptional regulator [Pseudomonas saudiphocaensis]